MKTYNISIDMFDGGGLDAISLVTNPAVEYNFLAFSADKVKLQFTDEEKHIITGVSLLADVPILRVSPTGEKFNVVFTKEVIRQLVEKYSKMGLNNEVNIQHNDRDFVKGVTMIESYIIDKARGICPKEFESVTDGSWITSFKVDNEEVWAKIKSGEVRGFSVQGIFELVERFNSQFKKENKMSKLKEAIKNLLISFSEVETDKGLLTWEEDAQLEVGYKVYQDGQPAPDGEYKVDNKVFVVVDGKVAEIRDMEVPNEENNPAVEAQMEEPVVEEAPVVEEPVAVVDEKAEAIKALEERVAALEALVKELKAEIMKPAAAPVEDEFNAIQKKEISGNAKLERTLKAVSAFKN